MAQVLERVIACVWGVPMLVLILGVGLYLSCITGFAQLRLLPKALKAFLKGFTDEVRIMVSIFSLFSFE